MMRQRAITSIMGVWATAISTLFAGIPHFDCRCPNGHIKPFCLALLIGKTGCCCEGSCCASSPREDGKGLGTHASPSLAATKKTCCCCKAHREVAGNNSRTDVRLEKLGCQKTL